MTAEIEEAVAAAGDDMHGLMRRLYPICRSLAGPGNRQTLDILSETMPLERIEVPSGTAVFDWAVPDEWVPRAAEIVGPDGVARARFADHNLHLVSHSEPVDLELERDDLLAHVFTLPDQPDVVPYVTRYYRRDWGFCMTERQKASLPPGRYRVRIDAELRPGALSIGETVLAGRSPREILIVTYICHPSMANDNLSGVVVAQAAHALVRRFARRQFSYRFLFVPETIGSIAWLALNRETVRERTHAALVLSCLGSDAPFTYKASRRGDAEIDRAARLVLADRGDVIPFSPVTGSDERQFCSPGFDLPAGLLSRAYPGTFAEYHTSADTPDRIAPATLAGGLRAVFDICDALERNATSYRRADPYGEPMLSKRDLYDATSVRKGRDFDRRRDPRTALMWVANLADGTHSLFDMAERSGLSVAALSDAAERAADAEILVRQDRIA